MDTFADLQSAVNAFTAEAKRVRTAHRALGARVDMVEVYLADDGNRLIVQAEIHGEPFGTEVPFEQHDFNQPVRRLIESMFSAAADHGDAGFQPGAVALRLVADNTRRAA